jgi:hypothetical protein
MPVKRRVAKRRLDPERLYRVWAECLTCGFDFFDALEEIGLAERELRDPAHPAAREAWALYGPRIIAESEPDSPSIWALEQFGQPPA